MPKLKTHSGAKKRFRLTATGKVKFRRMNRNHLMRKKTKKAKRHLRQDGYLKGADAKHIKKLLRVA